MTRLHSLNSLFIRLSPLYALLSLYLSACSLEQGQPSAPERLDSSPRSVLTLPEGDKGDYADSDDPELIFSEDFTETLTQELFAGDLLTVSYHPARITKCERGGRGYLQHITGFYQIDDQPPQPFEYTPTYTTANRLQSTKIKIPEGEELSIWFYSVDTNGCEAWDSNFGHNYLIPIQSEASPEEGGAITFKANGEVSQSETLRSGSLVTILYEVDRLNECESYQNDLPQWGIMGHFKTDLSEEEQFQLTFPLEESSNFAQVELKVPAGETLSLWFRATNRYGCLEEDEEVSFNIE